MCWYRSHLQRTRSSKHSGDSRQLSSSCSSHPSVQKIGEPCHVSNNKARHQRRCHRTPTRKHRVTSKKHDACKFVRGCGISPEAQPQAAIEAVTLDSGNSKIGGRNFKTYPSRTRKELNSRRMRELKKGAVALESA